MEKTLVIIDGNSIINRAFYAIPDLTNKQGLHTNAIYGFTNMLLKIVDTYKPTHISVAFDRKSPTFRHIEFKEYKAGRKKMPDELREQFEPLKDLLDKFNIHRLEIDGYEADDIIGTVSKVAEENGFNWEDYWKQGNDNKIYMCHGKDNIVFHSIIFNGLLAGLEDNYKLVDTIVSTEYLNINALS